MTKMMTKCEGFLIGMAVGAAVGAAAGSMMMPRKKHCGVSRVLKAAGNMVDNLSDALGM